MAEILPNIKTKTDDQYIFEVIVKEAKSVSHHQVTLDESDYQRLTKKKLTPEQLIIKSFSFLLEREPKESILSTFNLKVISQYFPEYESIIGHK